MEFYFAETTFIFGINLLVAVPTTCVQFGLQANRPLKDYPRNRLVIEWGGFQDRSFAFRG